MDNKDLSFIEKEIRVHFCQQQLGRSIDTVQKISYCDELIFYRRVS